MATKTATKAGARSPKKASTNPKNRRTAYELLQALETQRAEAENRHASKMDRLNNKIESLRQRHSQRIAVSEITAQFSKDEIEQQMLELKAKLAAFRQANKAQAAS